MCSKPQMPMNTKWISEVTDLKPAALEAEMRGCQLVMKGQFALNQGK